MRSCCVFDSPRLSFSSSCCLYSLLSSCSSTWSSASSSAMWRTNSLCTPANEDLCTLAQYDPLTGYEPNDYHISETTEPCIQESSGENGSLNSHDLEHDDYRHGALFTTVHPGARKDAASRRQAYHSPDEGLSSSQSSSVGLVRTGRLVADQVDSLISNFREKSATQLRN